MQRPSLAAWLNEHWPVPCSIAAIAAYSAWGGSRPMNAGVGQLILCCLSNFVVLAMPIVIIIWTLDQRARMLTRNGIKPPLWPSSGSSPQVQKQFRLGLSITSAGYVIFAVGIIARIFR